MTASQSPKNPPIADSKLVAIPLPDRIYFESESGVIHYTYYFSTILANDAKADMTAVMAAQYPEFTQRFKQLQTEASTEIIYKFTKAEIEQYLGPQVYQVIYLIHLAHKLNQYPITPEDIENLKMADVDCNSSEKITEKMTSKIIELFNQLSATQANHVALATIAPSTDDQHFSNHEWIIAKFARAMPANLFISFSQKLTTETCEKIEREAKALLQLLSQESIEHFIAFLHKLSAKFISEQLKQEELEHVLPNVKDLLKFPPKYFKEILDFFTQNEIISAFTNHLKMCTANHNEIFTNLVRYQTLENILNFPELAMLAISFKQHLAKNALSYEDRLCLRALKEKFKTVLGPLPAELHDAYHTLITHLEEHDAKLVPIAPFDIREFDRTVRKTIIEHIWDIKDLIPLILEYATVTASERYALLLLMQGNALLTFHSLQYGVEDRLFERIYDIKGTSTISPEMSKRMREQTTMTALISHNLFTAIPKNKIFAGDNPPCGVGFVCDARRAEITATGIDTAAAVATSTLPPDFKTAVDTFLPYTGNRVDIKLPSMETIAAIYIDVLHNSPEAREFALKLHRKVFEKYSVGIPIIFYDCERRATYPYDKETQQADNSTWNMSMSKK